jgi:hypothetical protein
MAVAIWLSVLGSIGCIGQYAYTAPAARGQSPALLFVGDEMGYSGPEAATAGWHSFTFRNAGAQTHELLMFRAPDGETERSLDSALAVDEVAALRIDARFTLAPGESKRLGVELVEGVYVIFARPAVGHAADGGHGMMWELRVSAP